MSEWPDNRITPKLDAALVKIRGAIKNPHFDSENPHFRSKFASLKSVYEAIIPVCTENGVVVMQDLQQAEAGINCLTHVIHESGESRVFGPLFFPCTKPDAQGYASASTYARRYHLQGVFCVVGEPDDDGNAASESAFSSVQKRSTLRNKLIKASLDNQDKEVARIMGELNNDQKAELWGTLSRDQQKLLKESKARLESEE